MQVIRPVPIPAIKGMRSSAVRLCGGISSRRHGVAGALWTFIIVIIAAVVGSGTVEAAQVANPSVEGPVFGGAGAPAVASTTFDLGEVGYMQEEYFIAGTATAYTSAGPLGSDGVWAATPASTAPYKTRILVYRPSNAKKFNGTVVVEWLNVSAGLDSAPDWLNAHTALTREGFAWVGVSAQYAGVEGGAAIPGLPSAGLKEIDPDRYGSLAHPRDSFAYDIFSQVGQAIRAPDGANPLSGLKVKRLLAAGESQSAFFLVTYINAVHPLAGVYDGFLVHSRGGGSAPLSLPPLPTIATPRPARIRGDLRTPVLTFQTESDMTILAYYPDRQPDSEYFRLWEVAGTAHADAYTLVVAGTDRGDAAATSGLIVTASPLGLFECGTPVNSGPQHFVLKAAFVALDRWVRRGTPPPSTPRLEMTAGPPAAIVRDEYGNAKGGIRTPAVDVPIATLSGEGQTGAVFCILFGTTTPFDGSTLAALYPSQRAYLAAFKKATKRAVRAGHILKADAKLMKAAAVADFGD
jgi:hypothetical protein